MMKFYLIPIQINLEMTSVNTRELLKEITLENNGFRPYNFFTQVNGDNCIKLIHIVCILGN